MGAFMLLVGACEAVSRPSYSYTVSLSATSTARLSCCRSGDTVRAMWAELRSRQCWWQGMLAQVVACVGSSAAVFLAYTLVLVVRTEPWWQARQYPPFAVAAGAYSK